MNKIVYYVATSLDGYIAGPNYDVSKFTAGGKGVEQYLDDLKEFQTVIMGRKTYEFGYQYGIKPGEPAYPHMQHHIFSSKLKFTDSAENVHIEHLSEDRIKEIRASSPTDVYLCGGGEFAGWLMERRMIDQLKIKLNPIILGGGVSLFGNSTATAEWDLIDQKLYDEGLQILTYNLRHFKA